MLAVAVAQPALAAGDETGAQAQLRVAVHAFDSGDFARAEAAVRAAIDAPDFPALEPVLQHLGLALAAQVTLRNHEPEAAQAFAARATRMPQQDAADWRNWVSASIALA